jgi:prophage regulatory protein
MSNDDMPDGLQLVDMKWLTSTLKMTDKWIYKMIQQGDFIKPIKLGRSSRWRLSDIKVWLDERKN